MKLVLKPIKPMAEAVGPSTQTWREVVTEGETSPGRLDKLNEWDHHGV